MKITLIRHGRPNVENAAWLSSKDFVNWVDAYNSASLDPSIVPSQSLIDLANNGSYIVCSRLNRSIESAQMLIAKQGHIENGFEEAALPLFNIPLFKLKPSVWLVLFRVAWLLGFSAKVESYTQTTMRAQVCAEKLQQLAINNDNVIFVGHGILNKLISRELFKLNWKGSSKSTRGYWSDSHFEK